MKFLRVLLFASFVIGAVSVSPLPRSGVAVVVSSTAFVDRSPIPSKYTCDGEGRSPELEWTWLPDYAKSIVIVVDDETAEPDKSVQWVVWNIDARTRELLEGSSGGGVQGLNDYQHIGYTPPCPPPGVTHIYLFRLFGLDTTLSLDPQKLTSAELEAAMNMHVVAGGTLITSYTRALE
jgi:Raf kinase inhibitor-like YbhB/YbcL family protein